MNVNCHVRVAFAGREAEMVHLCTVLLGNCDVDTRQEDRPPMKLSELYDEIRRFSRDEEGEGCEMMYGMVAPRTFGNGEPDSCKFRISQHPCGLYTALYTFDSQYNFQTEDFLSLHKQCGGLPMIAIHACDDFSREKGTTVFSGGRSWEQWDNMQVVWFFMVHRYEVGFPPDEAVRRLLEIQRNIDESECDFDTGEIIDAALENIHRVCQREEITADELQEVQSRKRFDQILGVYVNLMERELWECEHAALWTANLTCLRNEWNKYNSGKL